MRALCFSAVIALTIGYGSAALASDLNPPDWRGDPFTTYQVWEFSDASNPAEPDDFMNPYVTPPGEPLSDDLFADIEYDVPYTPWIEWEGHPDYLHHGVWYVEDWIALHIPNNPEAIGPDSSKQLWIQLTYYADGMGDAQFFTDPPVSGMVETIEHYMLDPVYSHATYLITLEPNPVSEIIYILPHDCTIYVDEIVVDTICIPEPATLSLLLLSAGVVMRRRR